MNVLLGITGGIAAYKTPDLVRRLRERGIDVRVVMSESARQFVTATSLQAVSGHRVRTSLWDEEAEAAMGHIELARWADLVLIAPATADSLARLASGQAADLLSTLCLATRSPLAVAPAMNNAMWEHPAVQANVATLRERGVAILGPASGPQACGETGPGRMPEPVELADAAAALLAGGGSLDGRTLLITAGPTREAIDPVRFLSNRSSGKMGYALAVAARAAGARVILVSGPVSLPSPTGVERIDVVSADDMYRQTMDRIAEADIFIGTAAVADYTPTAVADQKIKKTADALTLSLQKTRDILGEVAALPGGPFTVGFAAETERLRDYALDKLQRKQLDMIVANHVGDGLAFDCDNNAVDVYFPGGEAQFSSMPKKALAEQLIALIADRSESAPDSRSPLSVV